MHMDDTAKHYRDRCFGKDITRTLPNNYSSSNLYSQVSVSLLPMLLAFDHGVFVIGEIDIDVDAV
jgi:hypothetical protein